MVIDSRSRDSSVYATPSRYEVPLFEDLFNVAGVRLAVPDLPLPAYLVGATRRSVPFSFDGGVTELTASLAVGDYASPGDLAVELAAAASSTGETFEVAYSGCTDWYTVSCSAPFRLKFKGRGATTPAHVLGFSVSKDALSTPVAGGAGAQAHTQAHAHACVAPYRCDFRSSRYVAMRLSPNAEVVASVPSGLDGTFAVIPSSGDEKAPYVASSDIDAFEKRRSPLLSCVMLHASCVMRHASTGSTRTHA